VSRRQLTFGAMLPVIASRTPTGARKESDERQGRTMSKEDAIEVEGKVV
jgi:hypothetical protein